MNLKIDLRFLLPPLLNLILILLSNDSPSPNQLPYFDDLFQKDDQFFLFTPALLSLLFATLFFLLTSIKLHIELHIHVSIYPLVFKFGDFSGPLALALLASFRLRPLFFFIAYLICIAISPWFSKLVEIVKRLWLWFYVGFLQTTPPFVLTRINLPPPIGMREEGEEDGDNLIVPPLLQEGSEESADIELGLFYAT